MISRIDSAGLHGIEAYAIRVEVDICNKAFPAWHTVGLAESEVRESKERVVSAIKNSGYDYTQRRITINLAPADIRKEGTGLDLPIALGLLKSSEIIQGSLESYLFIGELSLNGEVRPVRGVLPIAILARELKYKAIILPSSNAGEASVVEGLTVYAVTNLVDVVDFVEGRKQLEPVSIQNDTEELSVSEGDFIDVAGQFAAKRALEVSASGGHNILFVGSPGSGKTMLSSRIPTILPELSFEESLETSRIYSVMNLLPRGKLLKTRPFRAPHHSVSDAGLIGGGSSPKPGEVSLGHNGVLFLDELPEFKKHVLELLRQPLESGIVTISRAMSSLTYPAYFMLVAAMNPCPCGYLGHPRVACRCAPASIQKYRSKISGPLLDRIDLQIEVPPVPFSDMASKEALRETSALIRARVLKTRKRQAERFYKTGISVNAQMKPKHVRQYCRLDESGKSILKSIVDKFHLSARAFDRILKVARTIADMEASPSILTPHLLEAVQYRFLDRNII